MRLIPVRGGAQVEVDATPEQLYAVASDVTRVGEWSHECLTGVWRDGVTEAEVGARFQGRNRAGWARWSRVCEVTELTPPHRIAWRTVGFLRGRLDSTEWTLAFTEVGPGRTRIVQRYEIVRANPLLMRLYSLTIPAHCDRGAALRADLVRLGEVAAGSGGQTPSGVSAEDGRRSPR